jgi:Polyphosphate kinase
MPRNLERRVEILFPVCDPGLASAIRDTILEAHMLDTAKARVLLPDGTYTRVRPKPGGSPSNAQQEMIERRGSWNDS